MSDAPFSPNHSDPSPDPHAEQDLPNPVSAAANAQDTPDQGWEDWQTVQFPDALNLGALDQEDDAAKPTARPKPKAAKPKAAKPQPQLDPEPLVSATAQSDTPLDADVEVESGNDHDVIEPDWQPHVKSHPTIEVSAQAVEEPQAAEAPAQESVVDDQIEELLTLIRELNECNDALLGRVRYLEDALTQSQVELDREILRSQQATQQQQEQELALAAAQQKASQSADELEFIQQTVQRQQIQIETLEAQLETSQQRVAELERECALVQQKQQEQYHQLQESKQTCQDLRSRLQRQQRYTLQYKVALKKCLDVPPPRYQNAGESMDMTDAPTGFMPKVSKIQPWSSTHPSDLEATQPPSSSEQVSDLLAWMQSNPDLTHLFGESGGIQHQSSAWDDDLIAQTIDLTAAQADDLLDQPITPDPLADVDVTRVDVTRAEADMNAELEQALNPELGDNSPAIQPMSISYDVKHLSRKQSGSSSPEQESQPAPDSRNQVRDSFRDSARDGIASAPQSSLAHPPAEAEDALWEDLARLIDASTEEEIAIADEIVFEDGEFTDESFNSDDDQSTELFEPNPDLNADPHIDLNQSAADQPNVAHSAPADAVAESLKNLDPTTLYAESPDPSPLSQPYMAHPSATEARVDDQPAPTNAAEPRHTPPPAADSTWTGPFAPQANWPSPVVYPLRPQKPRRKSLAAVELPSFLKAAH